ncbi:hypothetical protein NB231_07587 [Nitrococcus mobilis Nb-231]|uniref:Uncharacterized protein n=1 Tax=Nitrococcus mobilis Nb-231 TaxID=314278 RepID=A4BTB2_9GAMM|nr:hypothetical protein NB231_07587 [Nitrococcus mobilis Nb-231]
MGSADQDDGARPAAAVQRRVRAPYKIAENTREALRNQPKNRRKVEEAESVMLTIALVRVLLYAPLVQPVFPKLSLLYPRQITDAR